MVGFLLIIVSITEYGCKHEPVLIPACDLENITFTATVEPVLKTNCYGCHSSITPNGGIDLTDFNVLAELVVNGKLSGVINREKGFSPMPPGFALDSCTVKQIDRWIADTVNTIEPPGGGNDHPCDPDTAYFQNQILPLLISNCATADCHDGSSEDNDVVLVDYASVIQTGKVKPGDPYESKLYKVIVKDEPDDRMPPPPANALNIEQTEMVKKWILQGALDNFCEDCDTTNVTFSSSVWPILETNCVGCHSGVTPAGDIPITNYNEVVTIANNGKLLGVIGHETGFSPMPKNGAKLADCKIKEIEIWIADGTPNN